MAGPSNYRYVITGGTLTTKAITIIHHHRDSILSGVYYIDVSDENMGDIPFEREDDAEYFHPDLCPEPK